MAFDYYACKSADGFVELRQERFRANFEKGIDHPHDVCAVAPDFAELRRMMATFDWSIDWSADEAGR